MRNSKSLHVSKQVAELAIKMAVAVPLSAFGFYKLLDEGSVVAAIIWLLAAFLLLGKITADQIVRLGDMFRHVAALHGDVDAGCDNKPVGPGTQSP